MERDFQQIGEELFSEAKFDDPKAILDRLGKMIDYGIKRQDWYEDQRNKILVLGLALLGLSSFLVAGILNQSVEKMPLFRGSAMVSLLAIVATSARIVYLYATGARETYTHRKLANIRSWFFAYVVNDSVADAAIYDEAKDSQNRKSLENAWAKFLGGWKEYAEKKNGFIVEDLQQVFILYLFQSMRRRSLRKMIDAAIHGSYFIACFLALTIITAAVRV